MIMDSGDEVRWLVRNIGEELRHDNGDRRRLIKENGIAKEK